jgi:hypothetical protein
MTANLTLGQRAIFVLATEFRSRLNGLYMAAFFTGGAAGSTLGGWAALSTYAGVLSSCRRWRGGSVQRSPWHAYRAAPSQERGGKKMDSTELS